MYWTPATQPTSKHVSTRNDYPAVKRPAWLASLLDEAHALDFNDVMSIYWY